MLIFNGGWGVGNVLGNGVVVGCDGGGWEILKTYARIEPYTKFQV